MASPNNYPGGLNLAGTVFANGPSALEGATYLSGGIQWLDTISGVDGALPAGSRPEQPVKTLAQALTNSAVNGVIVIGEGSSENVAAGLTISLAGLAIFGCGSGSSRPRYRFTGGEEFIGGFNITGADVHIENIYFPAPTGTAGLGLVYTTASGIELKDCYFECGAAAMPSYVQITGGGNRIDGCSFVVTASRPAIGLFVNSDIAGTRVVNCVFDGGSYGWSDYALKVAAAAIRVRQFGNTFANQSDIGHTVTATTYQIFNLTMEGTGNVLLTA